jgi:hypothetical protein
MIALVLSRARHLLSHSVLGSSLAGDGLLVRLRSTSIGLLGLVTAVGLGLIAFIAQLGWPGVFNAPIPGSPHEAGTVHNAIALTQKAPRLASTVPGHVSRPRIKAPANSGGTTTAGDPTTGSNLGGSRQLTAGDNVQAPASVEQPAPAPVAPAPTPAPEATNQPVATTPAVSSPAPPGSSVGEAPKSSSSGGPKWETDSKAGSKSHGSASINDKDKADIDGKSDVSPPTKSKGDRGSKAKTKSYPAVSGSPEYSPAKPDEEYGAVPASPPVAKEGSEAKDGDKDYGDDKGYGEWGKSGRYHH